MATLFPTSLDAPSNPTQTTSMAASGFEHDLQHININDAMRAVQQYLGTTNSAVPTSITYLSNQHSANITVLQGQVSTLTSGLVTTNANTAANTSSIATNNASITSLTATKLNLSGGTMTGALIIQYAPSAISASSYTTSQIVLSNATTGNQPPQLGFNSVGVSGMTLYLNASGLNAISGTGGTTTIINTQGQLNPASFSDNAIPATKLVNASITSTQLAPAAVTNTNLGSACIETSNIDTTNAFPVMQTAFGVPVGAILPYAGYFNNPPPTGWLPCWGQKVSRTTYASLYAVIGTSYGAGDGSTTFTLPALAGRTIFGTCATPSYGATSGYYVNDTTGFPIVGNGYISGAATHTLTLAEIPSHAHGVNDPTHAHGVADPSHAHSIADPGHVHSYSRRASQNATASGGGSPASTEYSSTTGAAGTGIGIYGAFTGIGIYGAYTGITIAANGGSGAHNTIPPNQTVMFIIKAFNSLGV